MVKNIRNSIILHVWKYFEFKRPLFKSDTCSLTVLALIIQFKVKINVLMKEKLSFIFLVNTMSSTKSI